MRQRPRREPTGKPPRDIVTFQTPQPIDHLDIISVGLNDFRQSGSRERANQVREKQFGTGIASGAEDQPRLI
jgi:hypothetical protein